MPGARLLIHPIRDVIVVNFQDASILDTAQVDQIGEELYDLIENRGRKKLVLDFAKVQFLSSSALGVLISLQKKAMANKAQVVICALRKELMKLFELTNLTKMFTFAANEDKALGHFGLSGLG